MCMGTRQQAAPAPAPAAQPQAAPPAVPDAPAQTATPAEGAGPTNDKARATALTPRDNFIPFERKLGFLGADYGLQPGSGATGMHPFYKNGQQVSVDDDVTWDDYYRAIDAEDRNVNRGGND